MLFVGDSLLNKSFFIIVKVFKNLVFSYPLDNPEIWWKRSRFMYIDCALISHSTFRGTIAFDDAFNNC